MLGGLIYVTSPTETNTIESDKRTLTFVVFKLTFSTGDYWMVYFVDKR